MNNRGYTKIDLIVREYLASKGQNTLHGYMQTLLYAIEGLRVWNKNSGKQVKTVETPMDNKRFVKFPKDYIGWSKVGIRVGDRIVSFVKDNSIALIHDGTVNASYINSIYGSNPNYAYVYDFLGYANGELVGYGWGHNGAGFFREAALGLQFSSDVKKCKVYMEYISDGFDPDCETLVNTYARELLRDYIYYCEARFSLGDGHRETKGRYSKYLDEYDDVKAFLSDISFEGINTATTKAYTQAPKM